MNIVFKDSKEFTEAQLKELFLSVGWESGGYPDKLKIALENSHGVYSAWADGELAGLMSAVADGSMNVYFPYLLVRPEYQGRGIGKKLVLLMLEKYNRYFRKALIAYDTALEFYKRCGFQTGEGKTPMDISAAG